MDDFSYNLNFKIRKLLCLFIFKKYISYFIHKLYNVIIYRYNSVAASNLVDNDLVAFWFIV